MLVAQSYNGNLWNEALYPVSDSKALDPLRQLMFSAFHLSTVSLITYSIYYLI